MTDSEWDRIAKQMAYTWHRSKWPPEARAFYRDRLDRFSEQRVSEALDKLSTKLKFMPTLAEILGTIEPSGVNGSGGASPGVEGAKKRQDESQDRWALEWVGWQRRTGRYLPEVDTARDWLRSRGFAGVEAACAMPGGGDEPGWSG